MRDPIIEGLQRGKEDYLMITFTHVVVLYGLMAGLDSGLRHDS